MRVVLVHGIATGPPLWDRLLPHLAGFDVDVVARPRTGDLAAEVAWLAPQVDDAWVVGISGGATLGLALAAADVPLAGVIAHEPAAGSLAPTLLAPVAAAFDDGGTLGLARCLYGPSWTRELVGEDAEALLDDAVTARELAMFRSFEPSMPTIAPERVLVTTGADSPAVRHSTASALGSLLGCGLGTVRGASHLAPVEAAAAFAEVVRAAVSR